MDSNQKDLPTQLYELIYGYVHCIGKTTYHAGFVEFVDEAEKWVRQNQCESRGHTRVPENDPIRWCPVRHCHMKAQKPWFAWRRVDQSEKICQSHDCRVLEENGNLN